MSELVSTKEIAQMLAMKHEYVRDRLSKDPQFPRPALMLSQKTKRWLREDVRAWIEKKAKECAR